MAKKDCDKPFKKDWGETYESMCNQLNDNIDKIEEKKGGKKKKKKKTKGGYPVWGGWGHGLQDYSFHGGDFGGDGGGGDGGGGGE